MAGPRARPSLRPRPQSLYLTGEVCPAHSGEASITDASQAPVRTRQSISSELLPGTLELLILKSLSRKPLHGYGIARQLEAHSRDVLQVGESSLYPALQRLLVNGWVSAEWGETDLKRRARFYRLTPAGRKRLAEETAGFTRLATAIFAVLENH